MTSQPSSVLGAKIISSTLSVDAKPFEPSSLKSPSASAIKPVVEVPPINNNEQQQQQQQHQSHFQPIQAPIQTVKPSVILVENNSSVQPSQPPVDYTTKTQQPQSVIVAAPTVQTSVAAAAATAKQPASKPTSISEALTGAVPIVTPVKKKPSTTSTTTPTTDAEENAIKKLINKYETASVTPTQVESTNVVIDENDVVEKPFAATTPTPVSIAPQTIAPSSSNKDQPRVSETTTTTTTTPKEKEIAAGVRKLVDVYENKPQQTSSHQPVVGVDLPSIISRLSGPSGPLIEPSLAAANAAVASTISAAASTAPVAASSTPAVVPGKLPKSIYERYEPKRAVVVVDEQPKLPEQPHSVVYQPSSYPEVRVFRSETSDLCAVLHIPSANGEIVPSMSSTNAAGGGAGGSRKSPKIRCVLRIDSEEPLVYHISTSSGRKVPFKVRHRNGKSIAVFGYHRVVDFNVGIESQANTKPDSYKAELEG